MSPGRAVRAALGCAFLVALGLLVRSGWQAGRALEDAQRQLPALRAAVTAQDLPRAHAELRRLQAETGSAHRRTTGLVWELAGHVPYLGRTPARTAALAAAADELTRSVAPALLSSADVLSSHAAGGAPLDLAAMQAAQPAVTRARAQVLALRSRLRSAPTAGVAGPVARAGRRLDGQLTELAGTLQSVQVAFQLLPPMLGADGPRRYFVGFQTNAESRGTGGLVGAYGVLAADRGRLRFLRLSSDDDLSNLPFSRADLGPDYRALYGKDARLFANANLSPHFPYAARQWLDIWQQQYGEHLDGAIATDPVALAGVLRALGPVGLPDGEPVTADNVVPLTERDLYARYSSNALRKARLLDIARLVVTRLLAADTRQLQAVATATLPDVRAGRVLVYSAHPAEEALLGGTALSGEVSTRAGPYAGLVVNNAAGNKIDYYLQRTVRYDLGRCAGGWRGSTVAVTLSNGAPATGLPAYVASRADWRRGVAPPASDHLLVSLFAAAGSGLDGAYLDGRQVAVLARTERGHPVYLLDLELLPGQSRSLLFRLVEPISSVPPRVPVQPLVLDQRTTVTAQPCGQ